MPVWALAMIAVGEMLLATALIFWRDREYAGRALGFWIPAGAAAIGITHFQTGSWRMAMLVPVVAYPVGLVATRFRPGQMFRLAEEEQSSDAAVRTAARKAGWRLAIELAVLGLVAYVVLAVAHVV